MRAQAEEEAAARLAQEQTPVRISTKQSASERRRLAAELRERVQRREAQVAEEVAAALEQAVTPRDHAFTAQIFRLFREAAWILRNHAFPDGQPLQTQHRWHVEVWEIFMGALERRMNGSTDTNLGMEAEDGGSPGGTGS